MPELGAHVERFLDELRRQNASAHTLRNYALGPGSISRLLHHSGRRPKPAVEEIDVLAIREWLGHLYEQRLTAVSMRRKLAAVRSLFKFLLREGVVAKQRRAPGAHAEGAEDRLPAVMTAEQTNTLVDGVSRLPTNWNAPIRRAIWRSSSCCTAAACASANWWA